MALTEHSMRAYLSPMRRSSRYQLACLVALFLLSGCATTVGRKAARAMYEGDYAHAIPFLTSQTITTPNDARVWARLGEAQYHTNQPDAARESFTKGLSLDHDLAGAHLFLGYMDEAADHLDAALGHYEAYLALRPSGPISKDIAQRAELLRRDRAVRLAKEALASERELKASTLSDSTVGVVYFNSERLSEPLRPLTKGLSEMLLTDFSKVGALRTVERLQTDRLISELQLSSTAAFDTSMAPRIGKLLGAAHLVGGDAAELGEGKLRFDPQIVTTKTGDVDVRREQVGELAQFFQIEKRIVWDVLKRLGIEPTIEEKVALDRVPTESFVAFLAFSRGLNYQDLGQYGEARKEYQKAANVDPKFKEAGAKAQEMSYLSSLGPNSRPERLDRVVRRQESLLEWAQLPVRTDERLSTILTNTGLVRPASTSQGTDNPYTPPSANSTVIINGGFDEPPQ